MNDLVTNASAVSTNIVRPVAWTMARVNAERRSNLRCRISEAQAHSTALTAEVMALVAADADHSERTKHLWDVLDALGRMRIEHWVLSQDGLT